MSDMHEGFSDMEVRLRKALGLGRFYTVEPTGAVQGDACSEVGISHSEGGYSVVTMDELTEDFEATVGKLRRIWFPREGEE